MAADAADSARWPFERAAWSVERRALWPLQRRFAGWSPPGHRAGAAVALAGIGVAAILAAVLILPGGRKAPHERAARPARVAILQPSEPQPKTAAKPQEPTLHGVRPHFGLGKNVAEHTAGVRGSVESAGSDSSPSQASSAEPKASATAEGATKGEEKAAATASTAKPVPAGPVAMKTARRFAEAFVFYEIGKKPARAKTVFGETATEGLAKALEERPPRLPPNGRVPKAKVLNLVAGPRFGRQYTVSVALLRVGVTSELRITLQKEKAGEWRVAQVLG